MLYYFIIECDISDKYILYVTFHFSGQYDFYSILFARITVIGYKPIIKLKIYARTCIFH